MMLERGTPDDWRYKRAATPTQPRSQAIRKNAVGISYLAPPNVLLFKAKHCRPKYEADFQAALPKLDDQDRENLRRWLADLHPGHGWLSQL
jgi:hypothetical protein